MTRIYMDIKACVPSLYMDIKACVLLSFINDIMESSHVFG